MEEDEKNRPFEGQNACNKLDSPHTDDDGRCDVTNGTDEADDRHGHDQDQEQEQDQGQAEDQDQNQDQDHDRRSDQEQSQEQNQDQEQDQPQDQDQGQDEDQDQDQDQDQDRQSEQDLCQEQGQDQDQDQERLDILTPRQHAGASGRSQTKDVQIETKIGTDNAAVRPHWEMEAGRWASFNLSGTESSVQRQVKRQIQGQTNLPTGILDGSPRGLDPSNLDDAGDLDNDDEGKAMPNLRTPVSSLEESLRLAGYNDDDPTTQSSRTPVASLEGSWRLDGVTPNEHIDDPPGISEPAGLTPEDLNETRGSDTQGALCYRGAIQQSANPAGCNNLVSDIEHVLEKECQGRKPTV